MSSFPNSSLINAASGIPLIATPTIESASICRFSSSSRAMSDIAAAMKPMRFPYTPTDRQPIFTSFGASPPLIPRVKSQVTVSGDRCNSSAISFSERPFSLYSMALFAIEFTSFIGSPTPLRTMRDAGYQDIGLVRGLCRNRRGVRLQPDLLQAAQFLDLVVEDFPHVLHRQRAGVEDRIVEELVRIRFPESLLHVVAQLDDEILADQVRQLVRRIVRVPFHFRDRAGALHPRLPHQEVDRLVEGHLARVQVDVDQDSAGPPDLVEELHELRLRVGAESGLLHHVLAVMGPALDRLRRVRQDAGVRRIQARARELQMMSGISLVDRRVPDARVRMLAQHLGLVLDRRHHVESLFVRLEPRRRVVRCEWDHVLQVRGRLDDRELFVRRNLRELVGPEPLLLVLERGTRFRNGLLEPRAVWTCQGLFARRLDHVQEVGDALRRLEGNLAPDLDRGSNPPLRLLQEAGRPFESSGDAVESPRQRSEGTHEEREQRVSDRLRTPRHRLPRADFLGLEDPDPEDVPEVPQVDALPRRQAGPIDCLDPMQEFLDAGALFEFRVIRPNRQAVIVVVNPDIRREDRIPFDIPIDDFLREGIDLGVRHAAGIAHPALALWRGSHAGTRRPLLSRRNLPNSSNCASCSAVKIGPSRHTSWSSSEHASQMPIPHFMYRSTLA